MAGTRCSAFGIKCDGYPVDRKVAAKSFHIRHVLFPKPTTTGPVSLPPLLSTIKFENENERVYFSFFTEKTMYDIAPHYDPTNWCRMMVQSCHVPSVRYGMLAIAALDRMASESDHGVPSLDSRSIISHDVHHQMAIQQYTKAIKSMRRAVAGGQDLRTTLISILIVSSFEAHHGDHTLANAQIRSGIELIYEWQATTTRNSKKPANISPNSYIVENYLYRIFVSAEISTIYPDTKIPMERQAARDVHDTELLGKMPGVFESFQQALDYKALLLRQIKQYHYTPSLWMTESTLKGTDLSQQSPIAPSQRYFASTAASLLLEKHVSEKLNGKTETEQKLHIEALLRWESAFESLMARPDSIETHVSTLSRLHCKTLYLGEATRFVTDLMMYDKFTTKMWDIVRLAQQYADETSSRPPRKWMYIGMINPLYFVGMKCRVSAVRKEAIRLLLLQPRKEGFLDSMLVGHMIRWIQEIEEQFLEGGVVPGWARIRPEDFLFDLKDISSQRAHFMCWQRMSPDNLVRKPRRTTVSW